MGTNALDSALRQYQGAASSRGAADSDADSDEEDDVGAEMRLRAMRAAAGKDAGSSGRGSQFADGEMERYQYVRGGDEGSDEDEVGPEEEAALAAFMAPGAQGHQ